MPWDLGFKIQNAKTLLANARLVTNSPALIIFLLPLRSHPHPQLSQTPHPTHPSHKRQSKRCRERCGQLQNWCNSLGHGIKLFNAAFYRMQIPILIDIRFVFQGNQQSKRVGENIVFSEEAYGMMGIEILKYKRRTHGYVILIVLYPL